MTEHLSPFADNSKVATALRYFPAMYRGTYIDEAAAIARAGFPPGTIQTGSFIPMKNAARMLAFLMPAGTTDSVEHQYIIFSPARSQAINMWSTCYSLASTSMEQAMDDVEEFEAIGGGGFQIFELLED